MLKQHSAEHRSRVDPTTTSAVDGELTAPLNDFVLPHCRGHSESESLAETSEDDDDVDKVSTLPWWKKPSPWWLLCILPFEASADTATIAPRIEIYTMLACSVHKPDIFLESFPGIQLGQQYPSSHLPSSVGLDNSSLFPSHPLLYSDRAVNSIYLPRPPALKEFQAANDTANPPSKRLKCASDPTVQAAVAKLTAETHYYLSFYVCSALAKLSIFVATMMGILSCATTAWWGAFSDRHGRTAVMGLYIMGLLFSDVIFIAVAHFPKFTPGGYWFLVVGPLIEGAFGGVPTAVAATHTYFADTTNEGNRSRIFSLGLGLIYTGMALGPTLGSLLVRFTGETLSVFYVVTCLHFINAYIAWFVLPESRSLRNMSRSRAKYASDSQRVATERMQNPAVGFLVRLKGLFALLTPLSVFMPEEERRKDNPIGRLKKDWNLTLMALGYGLIFAVVGSYSYKFQYAASTFGWSSETLGYWLGLIGATRAFFVTAILPVAIKLFKPKPVVVEVPVKPTETSPLLDSSSSSAASSPQQTVKKEVHSPSFDLALARVSLGIEVFAYAAMALCSTVTMFTVCGMLGAMSTAFTPAMQSATLAMYTRRGGTESGKLFGALSLIQALASQILGPSIYGFVYTKTVASFPQLIFFVTVVIVSLSLVLLSFIKLPKEGVYRRESIDDLEEP